MLKRNLDKRKRLLTLEPTLESEIGILGNGELEGNYSGNSELRALGKAREYKAAGLEILGIQNLISQKPSNPSREIYLPDLNTDRILLPD